MATFYSVTLNPRRDGQTTPTHIWPIDAAGSARTRSHRAWKCFSMQFLSRGDGDTTLWITQLCGPFFPPTFLLTSLLSRLGAAPAAMLAPTIEDKRASWLTTVALLEPSAETRQHQFWAGVALWLSGWDALFHFIRLLVKI